MTRNVKIGQTSSAGLSGSSMAVTARNSAIFIQGDGGAVQTSRKDLLVANQELAQANQRLQDKVQRLTSAYQAVEQQNVALHDRCLQLQNRADELKLFLASVKLDVGQRVPSMRLIAEHLYKVASFLESLDQSIEIGGFGREDHSEGGQQASGPSRSVAFSKDHRQVGAGRRPTSLETIKETVEASSQQKII